MPLVRMKIPDQTNLSEEDKAFWQDAIQKHGVHKDSGFFDKPEKPVWYSEDGNATDKKNIVAPQEPSFGEKVESFAYGFNKGVGKAVDSVSAAGNALYGASAGVLKDTSKFADFLGVPGAKNLSNDFEKLQKQSYKAADESWNGKVVEQYYEDNKPKAIDKYKGTEQQYVVDNWVSAGHSLESLAEMAMGGGVLRVGGKGIALLSANAIENTTVKNFLLKSNKVTKWLNNFLTTPVNKTTMASATAGGYLANDFREKDEVIRENTPVEDTARSLGGYIAGDVAVRGGYGTITGTTKFILKSSLNQDKYNKVIKTIGELPFNYREPYVRALQDSLDTVQETVGNWLNGLVFKPNTEVGKLSMQRIREIERSAKDAIEYVSDSKLLEKGQNSFASWLINKKGNALDMDFIEAVSPELKNILETSSDKKTIIKELSKNKDLLTAYTIQKNNKKALDIAMYLPEYTLKEKLLKNVNKATLDIVKQNTFDFSKDISEYTFTNKVGEFKELLPEFKKILSTEREQYYNNYKQILNNNPNSTVSLEKFLPELKKLADDFKIFSPTKKGDVAEISEIEKVSNIFNNLFEDAKNSGSKNINGNIIRNAIDPIELVNKRQSLNDLAFKGNGEVEKLHLKAVDLIDRVLEKNVSSGNLPTEFLTSYRKALDFDSKVHFSYIQDEVIKTLTQGEPTNYLSNIMNTSAGVEQVRTSLSKTVFNYKNFQQDVGKKLGETNLNPLLHKNKESINNLDARAKELFSSLRKIKLKKLILEDFINYEKTSGKFDFDTFKVQSVILNNSNLIRSLVRDEKQADFIINKLPNILHKVGELSDKIKSKPADSNNLLNILNKFATRVGVAGVIGGATGFGALGGIAVAGGTQLGWNMLMRGVANSFNNPETTMKLIGLIEKGADKNTLKFLLKQASIYAYPIIKNDIGGSKEFLKDKINSLPELEPFDSDENIYDY